jgi:hydroxymethylpyrimidine pyrophosphatase-like HAD family hydrolase
VCRAPSCTRTINAKHLGRESVEYFDKDGFELTPLEQRYYSASGFQNKIGAGCLYHTCWQEPWFRLDKEDFFHIDHSMILHRCDFQDDALIQLYRYSKSLPQLNYLISCKKKWGLDFSLDYMDIDSNKIIEVIHVEHDTDNYEEFLEMKYKFERFVLSTDWNHATDVLLKEKDKWLGLKGIAQNNWKANFFGYDQAEITLKSI